MCGRVNRKTSLILLTVFVLGVSVYASSLLVIRSLSLSAPVELDDLFIAVFYINTINLLYMVFLAYVYTNYSWLFIDILSSFVRFFGRVDEEYSISISKRVYEWTIRNAGFTTGSIVAIIFVGSLWKIKLLLGFSYPLGYIILRLLLLPHTLIELIAFYIALWGTIRMHYRGSLVAGVSLTATLMLLAAAVLEAYVSPILLYYYM